MYGEDYERSVEAVARRELRRFLDLNVSLEALLEEVTRRADDAAGTQGAGALSGGPDH
jgi:hypothetical protein